MSVKGPSKNTPCPCGSRKKYRKCCKKRTPTQSTIRKVEEIFRKQEDARKSFVDQHGHIKPPVSIQVNGKSLVVIGSDIYQQTTEGPYTYIHAIHDQALHFFGEDYLAQEEQKPLDQRHIALQWMYKYVAHTQSNLIGSEVDTSPIPIGAGAAWLRFAHDLYTIKDNATLQKEVRKRLLTPNYFQSARHELRVAALFVASNFTITYEDETDNSRKHPEFTAADNNSSTRIAVEAKSRHRYGVNGFTKGSPTPIGEKVDIRQLITDAYKKNTDIPLYIFIDLNLPPFKNEEQYRNWLGEISMTLEDLSKEGYADPCPANIIFFHNDPSHHILDEAIGQRGDSLWISNYRPSNTRVTNPKEDICERIMKAHKQRTSPPSDFPNFN